MRRTGLVLIIISILLMSIVYAEEVLPWAEGEAKSNGDPLYMEMPENVHQMIPVSVKVYINDEKIKKEAMYAEISVGSSTPYGISRKITLDPSGEFRQTMPYNGEKTLEFGFRPSEYHGQSSSAYVTFYKIKKVEGKDWPDTSSVDSEFKNYNCHIETNKLMCSSKEGCIICNLPIGTIIREYQISRSEDTVSPPSRFSFTDMKDSDENLKEYAPQYEKFSYSEEKKLTDSQGHEWEFTDSYSIELDVTTNPYPLKEMKESSLGNVMSKQQGMVLTAISPPGGLTGGYAFEGVYFVPPLKNDRGIDYVYVNYELWSEMSPVGSGLMSVKASRTTTVPSGGAESEKDAVIAEAKAFAASYLLSKGAVSKPARELTHKYSIRSAEPQVQETTEDHIAYGTVTNSFGNPMPYMKVSAEVKGNKYIGYTDEEGVYKIPIAGLDIKEGEEIDFKVYLSMQYRRNGKDYFDVSFRDPSNQHKLVQAVKDAKLKFGEHSETNFKLDGKGNERTNFAQKDMIRHYSTIYYHTHEALDFVLDTLKEDMDYKLPLHIYVGNPDKKTLYSPQGYILISADDASISDSDRPKNREYHEFMHALMYDMYNAWPEGRALPGTTNHDGFLNPSTADSYMEGFAEFMAMVISGENGDYSPNIYASFGSMENNFRPWDGNGFDEEFAVASLLWDMYDSHNDKGDRLTMTMEEIWKVLKVKRKDFYEYYTAFRSEYPKKAKDIDDLFKEHGFFHDTRTGDGKYTPGEPWKYINEQAGTYRFIDMGENVTKIAYQPGFVIGKAANYNRSTRSSAAMVPGAFLKVADDEVDFYTVKVGFADPSNDYEYKVDRKGGVIYIHPLPLSEDAKITVVPDSKDFISKKPYEIRSKDLNGLLGQASAKAGYFSEHEFDLKPTGNKEDAKYELYENTAPTYSYEGDLGEEYEVKVNSDDEFNEPSAGFPFFKVFLFLSLGAFIYLYFRSPNVKRKTDSLLQKIKDLVIKAVKWFIRYGVPFMKKVLVWLWNMAVKISRFIFHHTRNAYNNAKPHVKKAHEHIKAKIGEMKTKKQKK
ncbi:MAG: hypothetical protein NDI94_01255 [Candidatus Woesearchaeota archaeon]|nr:hypothetical protein [Candidatus Woesearchaeota archaeon]